MKPIADRVAIIPAAAEEKTKGGLIIPDTQKEKPLRGKVAFLGPRVTQIALGDEIIYGKYAGQEIEFEGVKYLIMREDDVIAVLEDGEISGE